MSKILGSFAVLPLSVALLLPPLSGCSHAASTAHGPAAPSTATTETSKQAATPAALAGSRTQWSVVDAKELPLRMRVPNRSQWQISETGTSLRLEHSSSKTRVVVRLWPASRLVTVDECRSELTLVEPDAKLALQLGSSGSSGSPGSAALAPNSVVTQSFEPGEDLRGTIEASVRLVGVGTSHPTPPDSAGPLTGVVFGIAAGVGRCLALVAHTSMSAATERQLADQLAMLVDGMAKSLVVRRVDGRYAAER